MKIPTASKGSSDEDHRGFPLHVFPESIQAVCREYCRTLSYNIDLLSLEMLTALSSAVGSNYKVKVRNRHIEPAIIWGIAVGKSGTKKTHILNELYAPFEEIDRKRRDIYQADMQLYEANDCKGTKPKSYQPHVLSDMTYESLAQTVESNPQGVILKYDEIMALMDNFNRYTKGSDEPYYLTLFGGKDIIISRKTQDTIHTNGSFVNIIGGIQPARLGDLLTKRRMENGFAARFLFAFPDARAEPWPEEECDQDIVDDYHRIILGIRNQGPCNGDSTNIRFSVQAMKDLRAWQKQNTVNVNEYNDNDNPMAEILSKWESYVVRFALILAMAHEFCTNEKAPTEIPANCVKWAIELFAYFLSQTEKAFALIERPEAIDRLSEKQLLLYSRLPEAFTTAEAEAIAKQIDFPGRTMKDFIAKPTLFLKVKYGHYEKRIK